MSGFQRIAVLGDGAWGTALACLLAEKGLSCILRSPFPEYAAEMQRARANPRFLPGIDLPDFLEITADLAAALDGAELVILAVPVPFLRAVLEQLRAEVPGNWDSPLYVNVAKGIELGSLRRVSEIAAELLPGARYAVVSGPSHAEEVARAVPTAVVAAASCLEIAETVQAALSSLNFRVYTSTDVVGVELGGALKNVLALAAGVCDGMGLGDNSKAALMTRGIAELARLGRALGGRPETFAGLSGVGDLIVTCISRHSRNRFVGEQLGRGRPLAAIQEEMGLRVAEGVKTAKSARELARRRRVETPIIDEVYAILYQGKDPHQALLDLMRRAPKPELEEAP